MLFTLIGAVAAVSLPTLSGVLLAGLAWQLGYAFDCVDGEIARKRKTASAAGSGVDAIADVISQTIILSAVVYIWLFRRDADGLVLLAVLVLAAGTTLRSIGPLWTVATKYAKTSESSVPTLASTSSESALRAAYRLLERAVIVIGDPGIVLVVLTIALLPIAHVGLFCVAAYVFCLGGIIAVLSFLSMLALDNFR